MILARRSRRSLPRAAIVTLLMLGTWNCSSPSSVTPDVQTTGDFVVLAWNDLGMHCLNPTYDQAVILPPYNTLWAQVIRRGNPPSVVTQGISVEYAFVRNTTSYTKTDDLGGDFGQFWDRALTLFGVDLARDRGLNLSDPAHNNGLAGTMVVVGDHFEAVGIPLTPVNDLGVWNPYQVAVISVLTAPNRVAVETQATAPTSDEIHCALCHAAGGPGTASIGGGGDDVFANILAVHDARHGDEYAPSLVSRAPVLCAGCHASPALGTAAPRDPEMYLSAVIHESHAARGAACYDCHPGAQTRCNRSLAHTTADGNCTTCHGDLNQVANSISHQGRIPWVSEPACATCHTGVQGVGTGGTLYRNARGHGGVYCAGCHGSPHAMVPSSIASDNHQAVQYQKSAHALGSCAACHRNSHGGGASEFSEVHGQGGERGSACNICHTAVSSDTSKWPHGFTWKSR